MVSENISTTFVGKILGYTMHPFLYEKKQYETVRQVFQDKYECWQRKENKKGRF